MLPWAQWTGTGDLHLTHFYSGMHIQTFTPRESSVSLSYVDAESAKNVLGRLLAEIISKSGTSILHWMGQLHISIPVIIMTHQRPSPQLTSFTILSILYLPFARGFDFESHDLLRLKFDASDQQNIVGRLSLLPINYLHWRGEGTMNNEQGANAVSSHECKNVGPVMRY